MTTIKDVAKLAGVSISTVSLALNQRDRVSEKTFRKVMEAAAAAGYAANPIAQSLKLGRSPIISMIVSDVRNAFAGKFLGEIEKRAFEKEFLVTLSDTAGVVKHEAAVLNQVIGQRVAGMIISPTRATSLLTAQLRETSIPVILIDHKLDDLQCDFVGLDNRLAIGILVRHLVGHGHTRIGYVGGTVNQWASEERKAGFLETMTAAGMAVEEQLVANGNFVRSGGYEVAAKMLVGKEKPTALIAANHEMMLGVLQATRELGFRCPEDLSICCVDGVPWGDVLVPQITHVAQPIEAMATQASEWLLERIESKGKPAPPREKLFAPEFNLGASCAPPSG
jgi:LacI family transcriptional regulator